MYADVQENEDGAAVSLEEDLRKDAAVSAWSGTGVTSSPSSIYGNNRTSGGSRFSSRLQGKQASPLSSASVTSPQAVHWAGSDAASSQRTNTSISDLGPAGAVTERKVFLLLCVNGPSHKRWSNVDISSVQDDEKLFEAIRREYAKLRQSYVREVGQQSSRGCLQRLLEKLTLCGDRFWDMFQVFFIPKSANFVKVGIRSTWKPAEVDANGALVD